MNTKNNTIKKLARIIVLGLCTTNLLANDGKSTEDARNSINPFFSQRAASNISETSIVEVPLDGTGANRMVWAGVAQFGNGPLQLVIEVPRASKWMGDTCLQFITMRRQSDAFVSVFEKYIFTYENVPLALSGSYKDRPDPERFGKFERVLTIKKINSAWEMSVRMRESERTMRWTSEKGDVQTRSDIVASMKQLQNNSHCSL